MNKKIEANADIEPTSQERQAILEELWLRNRIRADAKLARLDVPMEFSVSVRRLRMKKFDQHLKPFLEHAMATTPGSPGIAGRLKQRRDAVRQAEDRLMEAMGIRRPAASQQVHKGEHMAFAVCVVEILTPPPPQTPHA